MTIDNRSKLVVIDMQKDFRPSESVVKAVCDKIEKYKSHNCKIYVTMDMHNPDTYPNSLEAKMFQPHCIRGTDGSSLVDDVGYAMALYRHESKFFEKESFGCQELIKTLVEDCKDGDTIEICGVCSDICVVSNAIMIKGALNNHELFVDSQATEGTSEEANKAALFVMRSCGVTVL